MWKNRTLRKGPVGLLGGEANQTEMISKKGGQGHYQGDSSKGKEIKQQKLGGRE